MENTLKSIEKRLERIELLIEKLVTEPEKKIIPKKRKPQNNFLTEDEIRCLLLKTVFNRKK